MARSTPSNRLGSQRAQTAVQKSQSLAAKRASQKEGTKEHNGAASRTLRSANVAWATSPSTVKKGGTWPKRLALSPLEKAQQKVAKQTPLPEGSPSRKRVKRAVDEDEHEQEDEDAKKKMKAMNSQAQSQPESEDDEEQDEEDEEDEDEDGNEGKLCLFLFAFLFVFIGSAILAANAHNFSKIYRKLF